MFVSVDVWFALYSVSCVVNTSGKLVNDNREFMNIIRVFI